MVGRVNAATIAELTFSVPTAKMRAYRCLVCDEACRVTVPLRLGASDREIKRGKMEPPLQSFRRPPLVETAVALQFNSVDGLKNAHLGILWQAMRGDFPLVSDAQPLPNQTETFNEQGLHVRRLPIFQLAPVAMTTRLQMASADDRTMVQIQNGRIILNWRKGRDGEYPRWRTLLPKFKAAVDQFNEMLAAEKLGPAAMNQWEVVYVNHLVRGRDWDSPADWPALLPGLVAGKTSFETGKLESLYCRIQLLMPDNTGRIHVDLFHGSNGLDTTDSEVLALQITARGGLPEAPSANAYDGLELGHQAIVRTFCDLTGPQAQSKWEREK